ncbi:carboxymuconolactone decarboxylase family protein [Roseibium aestuarii]|uniref:Carboxymuconolactone decarboxylase family protein n=1 Tax=Roseibium aestuarii TaxID=2600299 RepID=A0ABW4K017_9HYPH|nr:carboxymuconolactone decarboxylase family protein [Roseibium aestuarii]
MNALSNPVAYERVTPEIFSRLVSVYDLMASADLPATLFPLISLRASQINQCAYCVNMHLKEAVAAGETEERLGRLIVWRHVKDFTPAERAVLAWTEALTVLQPAADYEPLRAALREHFSDNQISVVTVAVAMINMWNRIQVSKH